MEIKSYQRKYLRSLAHHIKPVAQIGKLGITEGLLSLIDQHLSKNELIKIKFLHYKDNKKKYTEKISNVTKSSIAGYIGNVAILYRRSDELLNRHIKLPNRSI